MRFLLPLLLALLAAPIGAQQGNVPVIKEVEVGSTGAPIADTPIVLLVDADTGQVLVERNAGRRFIPASITKVMSAYLAFNLIEKGRLNPQASFTVSDAVAEEWSRTGSTMFLEAGDEVALDDLLMGITSVSANDASVVLAEGALGSVEAWVDQMNLTARTLGMRNTRYGTPNGWPDEGRTFTTAHDLALLARALVSNHPDRFARHFGQEGFAYNGFAQANRDPIRGVVAGADGIKTGFTREAGNGFLGTAKRGDRRLVMVVAASDSEEQRAQVARDLLEWGFASFEERMLFGAGQQVASARVQNGSVHSVALRAGRDLQVLVPTGASPEVKLTLRYEGPLRAPISAGEAVAQLEVAIEGMRPFRVPLNAVHDVPKASLWQRLANGIGGIFA